MKKTKIINIILVLIFFTSLNSGCGKEEQQTYKRLTPESDINSIEINGDLSNYLNLLNTILPDYKITQVCQEEFDRVFGNSKLLKEKEIFSMNKLNCEENVENNSLVSLVKYKGISYAIAFYEGDNLNVVEGVVDDSCLSGAIKKIQNKTYEAQVTVYGIDVENGVVEGEYCPKKSEFDMEQMQFSNYIYDSFLKVEK